MADEKVRAVYLALPNSVDVLLDLADLHNRLIWHTDSTSQVFSRGIEMHIREYAAEAAGMNDIVSEALSRIEDAIEYREYKRSK
jgi:hypothetical protein